MTPAPILDRISAITEHTATRDLSFSRVCCLKSTIPRCDAVSIAVCCTWTAWPWTDRLLNAPKCRELPSVTSHNTWFFVWDRRVRLKIVSLSSTSRIKILCDGYVKIGRKFLSQSIKSQHLRNLGAFTYCITGVGSNLIFNRSNGFVM